MKCCPYYGAEISRPCCSDIPARRRIAGRSEAGGIAPGDLSRPNQADYSRYHLRTLASNGATDTALSQPSGARVTKSSRAIHLVCFHQHGASASRGRFDSYVADVADHIASRPLNAVQSRHHGRIPCDQVRTSRSDAVGGARQRVRPLKVGQTVWGRASKILGSTAVQTEGDTAAPSAGGSTWPHSRRRQGTYSGSEPPPATPVACLGVVTVGTYSQTSAATAVPTATKEGIKLGSPEAQVRAVKPRRKFPLVR